MQKKDMGVLALVVIAIIGIAILASPAVAFQPPTEDGKGPYIDYTSKYAATAAKEVTEGTLYLRVQCGHNLFTKEVTLQQVIPTTGTVVVSNGAADPLVVAANFAPVGGTKTLAINADGTMDTQMPAGTFTATVADGNGGQPETVLFKIKAGQTTTITVLGHAVTAGTEEEQRVVTIERATYGKIITVVDQPAYDETIPSHYEYVGHNHGDFNKMIHHGQTFYIHVGHNHGDYDFVVAQTIHHAAVTHQEGSYIDVTAAVQAAMDAGEFSIVFDNAKNPGGLFDNDGNLLTQITDPAVGIVKDVHIEYDGKVLDTKEYEVINL